MKTLIDATSDLARLRDALDYAVSVIESYQMDIRNHDSPHSGIDLGLTQTLAEQGFCQGTIYTDALPRIARILAGTGVGNTGGRDV